MRGLTSTTDLYTNATTGGAQRSDVGAGAGAGAGVEAQQSRDAIAELVGHSEATMNAAYCASIGKALFELNAKYLPASLGERQRAKQITQALIDYEKHVKERASVAPSLAQAWEAFKRYLQGSINFLDRVTVIVAGKEKTFVISPKEVFALVYLATMDDKAYGEQGSVNHKARLETLDNTLVTLHDGTSEAERCHLGVRNDLVGVLNHVYPGIALADDATTFLLQKMKEWMGWYIASQKASSSLWLAWLRDGEVPKLEDGQREQLEKHLCASMRKAGFEDRQALTDCMTCLSDLSPGLGDNRHLYALNGFYEYQAEQAGNHYLDRVAAYLDENWRLGNDTITQGLLDFLRVMKVRGLLEHSELIQAWDEAVFSSAILLQARQIVDQFLKELDSDPLESVPSLSSEAGKQLDQAIVNYLVYRRDQRLDWVENYFVHYFHAPDQAETRKRLFSSLFDEDVQAKLFYADHELQALLPNSADEVQLSVYQVNRIFLQGLLQSPEDWSAIFAERFGRVLAFVKNNFNVDAPSARLAGLRADSYPAAFLNQLTYLHERYRYKHRNDEGGDEEKDMGGPDFLDDMPFYVPSCVCREDLSRVAALLTKEAQPLFGQALPAKLQAAFVIYPLIEALKAQNSVTFVRLYQLLFGSALTPDQILRFDAAATYGDPDGLLRSLEVLNEVGILTQDNFRSVLDHHYAPGLASALERLFETNILTQANFTAVAAHANPFILADSLKLLFDANILIPDNRRALAVYSDLVYINMALDLLFDANILTQDNFVRLLSYTFPQRCYYALDPLNKAGILTQDNFAIVAMHVDLVALGCSLVLLNNAGILTQDNFDAVAAHPDPQALTCVFVLLARPDGLARERPWLITNFRVVLAHENPALIRLLVEAIPEKSRENVLRELQSFQGRDDGLAQPGKQNDSVIRGYCYKYGCSCLSLFGANRAQRDAAIERLIFPEKYELQTTAQTMRHKSIRAMLHK